MKAIWSGSLTFGLVNIPIKLYSAISKQVLGFKMLCGKCNGPIEYKRWCPHCKKEVAWDNIVKGIEVKSGEFYVLTKEKIEELKPEKTEDVSIVEFIDKDSIEPIYFENHYYVGPKRIKEKAYFLFKEVLEKTEKMAIGRFVMRDKEYVCAIESYKEGILLTTLNYAYEIRDIKQIEALDTKPRLSKEELKLAEALIKKMYKKKFDISKFKDTFAENLKKTLKQMMRGKKIKKFIEKKEKKASKETSLMEILKKSVKGVKDENRSDARKARR